MYQDALLFVDFIYENTRSWPKDEIFGLISQLRRSAVSIALNIAEGSSRTRKDFCHFLDLSRGSCYESATILTIALKRKYIDLGKYDYGYEYCNKLARMISKLKSSIRLQ